MITTDDQWVSVKERLPEEGRPFVVLCPGLDENLHKCFFMGKHTTHGRGIGIRPAGPEHYHHENSVSMWKYVTFAATNPLNVEVKIRRELPLSVGYPHPILPDYPEYKTKGSAGMDIHAAIFPYINGAVLSIAPNKVALIKTGLFVEIPIGYEIQIRPRSGLAANNHITVLNTPGTIDSDYRGEVKVLLINHGDVHYEITHNDCIAQMIVAQVVRGYLKIQKSLNDSERGVGGFGHTGK